jgi:radical SAM superfamily enzyme YgiQ (UPF0313 family)
VGEPHVKVLLIEARHGAEPALPLALAQIGAVLRAQGHDLIGVDLAFDSLRDVLAADAERAVIFALPPELDGLRAVVEALRARGALTALVGLAASFDPARARAICGADVAVAGDPEHAIAAWVRGDDPATIPGVHGVDRPRVARAPRVPLASLPLLDRAVFPLERYAHAMRSTASPVTATFTSRGCARTCGHCPMPARHLDGFDARPAEQVADEVGRLVRDHGVRCLHVEDDAFVTGRAHAVDVSRALRPFAGRLGWELVNGVRPGDVDTDLIDAMADGGCVRIVFGFEHLGPARGAAFDGVINDPAHARKLVAHAKRRGLRVGGYFIVGVPGVATPSDLRATWRALRLGLDDANFTPYVALPESPFTRGGAVDAGRFAHLHSVVATASFLSRPSVAATFARDIARDRHVLSALVAKAFELGAGGGPYPLRPQP